MAFTKEKLEELRKKYKHSAYIEATANVLQVEEETFKIAKASLGQLASVFSADIAVKLSNNPDLIGIASTLIRADEANLNDDCVMFEDLIGTATDFTDKYIDIEHDVSQIIGVINSYSFTDAMTDAKITNLTIANPADVQLVIGGYLWYFANTDLCDMVEESSALRDNKFSTSFELLYTKYWIGVGPSKKLADARIIVPEDKDFKFYDKVLKKNGGLGKEGENYVFCILKGILPVGAGIVAKPASGIKGILTVSPEDIVNSMETIDQAMEQSTQDLVAATEIRTSGYIQQVAAEINISTEQNSVINSQLKISQDNIIMSKIEIKSKEDIAAKWAELVKNEASASAITDFIVAQYEGPAREFADKIAAEKQVVATVEANKTASENKVKELEAALAALQLKLDEMAAAQAAAEAAEVFSGRMAALDSEFVLDDAMLNILMNEVKAIASNDEFTKWLDNKKILMKEKTKAFVANKKTEEEAQAAVIASVNKAVAAVAAAPVVDAVAVVTSVTEVANQTVSNAPVVTESLKDKMYNAFSKNVMIGGKKIEKKPKK